MQQTNHAVVSYQNAGWGSPASNAQMVAAADSATGAFPLANTASLDSALVTSLPAVGGGYSATISSASGNSGYALTEVYDDTAGYTAASTRLDQSFLPDPDIGQRHAGRRLRGRRNHGKGRADPGQRSRAQDALCLAGDHAGSRSFRSKRWAARPSWPATPAGPAAARSPPLRRPSGAFAWPNRTNPVGADSAAVATLPPGPYGPGQQRERRQGGTVLVEIYDAP